MTTTHMFGRGRARTLKIVAAAAAATMLTAATHPEPHGSPPAKAGAARVTATATVPPVAVVEAFHAALTKADTRAALDLLAENVLIFESGRVERSRAEYASHHLGSDAAFSAAVQRTLVDRAHGEAGEMAWVTSTETVSGSYRGRAINSRSVETMLLRQIGGQWRIVHIHWSSADIVRK